MTHEALVPDDPFAEEEDLPILDRQGALALMEDEELYAYFSEKLLEDFPARLADLRGFIARNEPDELVIKAHALKGLLAALGAKRAASFALGLERAARDERLADAARLADALDASFAKVREALAPKG